MAIGGEMLRGNWWITVPQTSKGGPAARPPGRLDKHHQRRLGRGQPPCRGN